MGNTKHKYQGLKESNAEKKVEASDRKKKALLFALSLMISGVGYSAACILFLFNDIKPPSNRLFYKCQKIVVDVLFQMAKDSAEKEFQKLVPFSNISIDGSWTQRRNSRTFILDAIDARTKKIIGFELLDKGSKYRPGNYEGPSNMMEATAFTHMITKLISNKNITGLIKDGDTKLEKIIKQHKWNVTIFHDPNHLKKNWPKLYREYNKIANHTLTGLKTKILAHLNHVLYSEGTPEEKREKFMNAFYHFLGNHSNCGAHDPTKPWKYSNDPKKRDVLFRLLNETANLFGDFDPTKTTNPNEFFHTLKGYVLPKIYHWESSWIGRISVAILRHNCGYDWVPEALERLHLKGWPLHTGMQLFTHLAAYVKKKVERKEKKQTIEAKKARKQNQIAIIKQESKITSLSHATISESD